MREEPERPGIEDLIADHGLTSYNRRLADKILNAFNQATSVGRTDVAELLGRALRVCIDEEQEMRNAILIEKADAWRAFVATRNDYVRAREASGEQSEEARSAMDAMRGAYVVWSGL